MLPEFSSTKKALEPKEGGSTMKKRTSIGQFAVTLSGFLPVILLCLLIPISAFGDDKLLVRDSEGSDVFKVQDGGNVAITTTTSDVPLLVQSGETGHLATFFRKGGNDAEIQIGEETAVHKAAVIGFNKSGKYYYMSVYGLGLNRLVFNSQGNLGVGISNPEFKIDTGGAYCDGSTWVNASSREYKRDIKDLTKADAVKTLEALNPVSFSYKKDPGEKCVGFIAEDVPDLVATKDRKGLSSMDVVAVLTKVVQEQQKVVQEQRATIAELSRRLTVVERGAKSE